MPPQQTSIYGEDDDAFRRPVLPAPSTAPVTAARSIYDDPQDDVALNAAIRQGQQTSPQNAARIFAVQQKTGLPTPVVERNLDDLETRIKAANFNPQQLRETYPALTAWLKEDPQRAALAADDLNHLGFLEWLTTGPTRAFAQAINQQRYSTLRTKEIFGGGLTQAERDDMASAKYAADRDARQGADYSHVRGAIAGLGSFIGQQVPIAEYALKGAGYAAGVGLAAAATLGPGAVLMGIPVAGMAAAGAATGALYGVLKSTYEQEAVSAYDEYASMHDEAGRPMDPTVAKYAAMTVGLLNAPIEAGAQELLYEFSPLKKMLSARGISFAGFTRSAVKDALLKPTFRSAILNAAKGYGTTLAGETGQEVTQQLVSIIGREVGVSVSNALPPAPAGVRADATPKGEGFLGVLPRADGAVSSEISVGVNIDGKEIEIPTLVPTLSREEVQQLLTLDVEHGAAVPQPIIDKAVAFARQRIADGKSPFAAAGEQRTDLFPELPRVDTSKRLEHATPEAIGDELLSTFTGALESFALGVLPGPAMLSLQDVARARAGARNEAFYQALSEGVKGSKTQQAFAPALQRFLEHATASGPVEDTYVPIAPFTQYWQSQGVDPEEMATALTGDPQAYAHAQRTGEDLRVKTATYATRIAPTEHHTFFQPLIRLGDPHAMNGQEAAEFDKVVGEQLAEAKRQRDAIQQDLQTKLEAAGERTFSAQPLSAHAAALFNTLVGRQGLTTPEERYRSLNVTITREGINDEAARRAQAEGLGTPAADVVPDIPPSVGNDRETRVQAAARRQAHTNALVSVITRDAQRQDPTVDPDRIRAEVEQRLEVHRESHAAAAEAGGGQDLLRAIARNGGLWFDERTGMFRGEIEHHAIEGRDARVTRSGQVIHQRGRATWNGVPGVFVQGGKTLEQMVEALREDGIHFDDLHALLDAVDHAMRAHATAADTLPGTAELDELGIQLGTRWWDRGGGRAGATVETDGYTQFDQAGVGLQSTRVLREGDRTRDGGAEQAGAAGTGDAGGDQAGRAEPGAGEAGSLEQPRDASAVTEFFQPAPALGEQLPPEQVAAIERYRERLAETGEAPNLNLLASAMREVGARLPLGHERARALLRHLFDVAHDTTTYSQQLPGFYSRLTRAVEASTTAKASGAQWKATIRNAKAGINADEFALTNIDDLDDRTTYTREEVLEYLSANELDVVPVTFVEQGPAHFSAHFGDYVTAGPAENYREVLLAVPNLYQRPGESYGAVAQRLTGKARLSELTADEQAALEQRLVGWNDGHREYDVVSNPIVRLRFNTRTLADGRRVLFLEEVQPPQTTEFEKMPALFQKHWRDIAMKWALHQAVEQGLDAVAWTPGQEQADRYRLERHIQGLWWNKRDDVTRVTLQPADKEQLRITLEVNADGVVTDATTLDRPVTDLVNKPLARIVGKAIADQVASGPEEGEISDADLRVGGEGLKKLYDRDLPNTVKNLQVVKRGAGELTTVPIVADVGGERIEPYYPRELVHMPPTTVDAPAISITPEMRNQIEAGQPLFQENKGGERGYVRFARRDGRLERIDIGLLRNADLSTFIHETGHLAFELMGDLVDELAAVDPTQLTATQKQLMADWGALVTAAGEATGKAIENRSDIGEAQHEWVARAMEAYVREGRAPSTELRSAFARMSAWLLSIYKSIRGLVTLTPEVRGIFDRMLASDEAIAAAAHEAHITPLFSDAATAGMTELEFASYQDQMRDASTKEQEELRARVVREFEREKTSWWREEHDTIRAQVERELQQDPAQRAVSILRTGLNPDGTLPDGTPLEEDQEAPQPKLSRDSLVAQFGRAILKRLPKGVYAADSGVSADTMAAMLRDIGIHYSNGDELVRSLVATRPLRVVAEEETQNRLAAKHGDLMTDGLQAAAQRIVEGEHRAEVVHAELEALTKGMVATTIPSAATINDAAARRIAETPIRELRPGVHLQAARRASQRAFDLLAKGHDRAGAVNAKLQELINLALYRHARDAQERVDVMRRRLQGYQTTAARQRFGKAGGTHLAQIDALMERFELAAVTHKQLRRRASLAEYVDQQRKASNEIDIDPQLLDESRRRNYLDMTYGEFQGVHDAIEQIAHIARLKNTLLKAARQRTFEDARDALKASIVEHNKATPMPLEETDRQKRLRRVGEAFASLSKMGHLARALDGHVDGGEMWEQIIRPMNAAADEEQVRKAAAGRELQRLFGVYSGAEQRAFGTPVVVAGQSFSLSREARLMIALNWGNEDNRQRLLMDPTRQWNAAQISAVLETLDKRDWDFVQGVWDYIDTYRPEIFAKQQRVTGLEPEAVVASPVETKFGTYRGGYFPIVFDPNRVARADAFQVANEAELRKQAGYVSQATTRRGHTQARQRNVKMSVRLDFGVIGEHIEQVVHDLTHHEMLIDVGRLLGDSDVQAAIYATKGAGVYRQFTSGLRDVAIGPQGRGPLDSWATWLRTRSQLAGLGLNLWTAVQQPFGVFNGARRIGPMWVAKGMKRWLRNAVTMERTAEWIWEASPMMRHRGDTATQDLADLRGQLQTPGGWFDTLTRTVTRDKLTQQDILDSFTWHIGYAQRFADIATWLGAYEKYSADPANAKSDGTLDEARVVSLADQAVIDSQGSGLVKDLSQAQRGNAWAKLFMTFYSYGSTVYNEALDAAGTARQASTSVGTVGTFLGHLSLLYFLPALATVALGRAMGRGGGDDEHGWLYDLSKEMLSTAFNMIPVVREVGGSIMLAVGFDDATGARGYEGPAALRPLVIINKAAQQIHQGEVDQAAIRAGTQLAGILFRFPAAQVQRSIDGYVALEEGRTHNPFALLVGASAARAR